MLGLDVGSDMARMGWVLGNASRTLDVGSDMARMGWVLGNAGSGVLIRPGWVGCWVTLGVRVLIWPGWVGCWVMLDVGF